MASCTTFMPSICLAGSRSHLRRGSWLRRLCPPLCVAPSRGLLRHACQVEHRCSSRLFGADGSLDRHHATRPSPWTASTPVRITAELLRRIRFKDPGPARRWSSSPTTSRFRPPPSARSTKAAGRWNSCFKWIKRHLRIKQFYGTSENAVKTQIWIAVSVYASSPSSRSASTWTPRSTLCYRSSR